MIAGRPAVPKGVIQEIGAISQRPIKGPSTIGFKKNKEAACAGSMLPSAWCLSTRDHGNGVPVKGRRRSPTASSVAR